MYSVEYRIYNVYCIMYNFGGNSLSGVSENWMWVGGQALFNKNISDLRCPKVDKPHTYKM